MQNIDPLHQFRNAMEKFVCFTEEEWGIFSSFLTFKTLKKKALFVAEGQVCAYFGFIVKGAVRYYHLKDGTEITGFFSFENELVSAYKSFLTQQPNLGYIEALENTEFILISHQHSIKMQSHPVLAHKMEKFGRLIAEYYLCCYEDRVTSFITKTPEERYLDLLNDKEVNYFQRVPQHFIANYLGITPVSLSRIRKRTLVEK